MSRLTSEIIAKFSILTATEGSTQKRIIPDADGKPVKDAEHDLGIYRGQVQTVTVDGPAGFAAVLAVLGANQAITLGVTDAANPQRLVTAKKLEGMETRPANTVARTLEFFDWAKDGYTPILLDHDPEPGHPPITANELWERFVRVMPEFAGAARVVTDSTSSSIYHKETGECLKPASGHHTYIFVRGDVDRFKAIFQARAWLMGEAFCKLGSVNKATGTQGVLKRYLIDTAVFSPERLVYEAGALIPEDAPFVQRRPDPVAYDGEGVDLDEIPDLTPEQVELAARLEDDAYRKAKGLALVATEQRILTADPTLPPDKARAIAHQRIESCERGTLAPGHLLYLQHGGSIKAGEITPQHHGLKLRDPQEPDYRNGEHCGKIYCDAPGQWVIVSFAHGGKKYRPEPAELTEAQQRRQRARDTKALKRQQTVKRALAILTQALPTAHRETRGGYLPPLPPLPEGFGGYALDAGMGGGKTTTIGRDIVAPARDSGGFTYELFPRNSLGQQTAEKHGIVHVHDLDKDPDSQQAFGYLAQDKGGAASCPNSIPRVMPHVPSRPTAVIDEAMATFTEALEGGTLKGRYSEVLEELFDLLRSAGTLTISESNLDAPTLTLAERVSEKRLMMIRHHGDQARYPIHLATGGSPNAMFGQMAAQLLRGERVWFCTTSLDEAHAWELWAKDNKIKVKIITGETNESDKFRDFFSNPDKDLEDDQTQFLITTQSVQTGLSVERYHFEAIYGYGPGFAPEVIYQMVGRYRLPAPRYIWVPEFIQPSRYERPQKASILEEIGHEVGQWAAKGFATKPDTDQTLIDEYLAARWEIRWAQKVIPGQALTLMFERAGQTVTPWELGKDEATKELRAEYREKLARIRSEFHAGLAIDPEIHDQKWAKAKRDDGEATYRDRCILRKLSTLEKFPGVDWDNAEIWYQAWFMPRQYEAGEQTHGPIAPGASLWAECGAADALIAMADDEAATILAQRLRSISLLPDYGAKLAILAPMRPLCEQILAKGSASPGCPLMRRLAAMARAVGDDLYRYLRIVAGDDHSDQAIANKILRKFGLLVQRQSYRTVGRSRQWSYTVTAPPLWQTLVDARQRSLDALAAKVSSPVTDSLKTPFNKSVTPNPPDTPKPTHRWPTMGLEGWVDRIEGGVNALFRAVSGAIFSVFVGQLEAIA